MQFAGLILQIRAEIGVGNVDQLPGTLADGFAIQVSHAIFGDNVADVVTTGHHARAKLEHASDASDGRAVFECGDAWKRDDGHTTLRTRSTIDEIELAANTTVQFRTDAISTDLTRKINFNRRVDGNHA